MKKIVTLLIILVIMLSLCACDVNNFNAIKEMDDDTTVNFDLTQYDAHGELSCGLIWVEKTESSYGKAPETEFAYADIDGNIVSEWFDSEEFNKANFVNDIVILKESPYTYVGGPRDYARCIVYNTQFNKLVDGYFKTIEGENANTREIAIIEANERGEVFGIANLEGYDFGLFMVSKDGIVKFPVADDAFIYQTIKNLERIKYENGYYIIDFRGTLGTLGNLPCYMGVFDKGGNLIFEPSERIDYDVYSVKVISENEFEILFHGKDGNNYTVRTDKTGKFLTEPK
ncbi:MAG: hypothetical protein E7531_03745 [Ruminococcaceae bacterium]|nr:hypothetical protein [Oscillospiraceae bacterium]